MRLATDGLSTTTSPVPANVLDMVMLTGPCSMAMVHALRAVQSSNFLRPENSKVWQTQLFDPAAAQPALPLMASEGTPCRSNSGWQPCMSMRGCWQAQKIRQKMRATRWRPSAQHSLRM